MGSKLGVILSLFFAIFVFTFASDLIALQANYSNLESIANSISLIISSKGSSSNETINQYMEKHKGIKLSFSDNVFKIGEFKDFTLEKNYNSFMIFRKEIQIKVERTVLVGQYEGTFE